MIALTSAVLAASTVRSVGIVIAVLVVLGLVIYALFNIRAGREEVGAEIELAPNFKPYLDDDDLETRKLDRTLTLGLAGLVLVGVGLPAYWLAEPGRQDGAIEEFDRIFADRGEELYNEGAGCNACHGPDGVGGSTKFTILDDDGSFVAQVDWVAPALNTVLTRYSREELTFIIDHGRGFSPMPAWGEAGGGPLTEQQINNLIDYLARIQITPEQAQAEVEGELRSTLGLDEGESIDYSSLETGEALFNLGQESDFAGGGAYACGRCHTKGWSIDAGSAQPAGADLSPYIAAEDGAGGYGPRLRDGIVPRQFSTVDALVEFLTLGAERGETYGLNGLSGDGMMPGFGDDPNTETIEGDGMFTPEMIESVARYVASLGSESADDSTDASGEADEG